MLKNLELNTKGNFKVLWLSGLSGVLLILFTEVQVLLRPYII